MTRLTLCALFLLLVVSEAHSQTTSEPFASVDHAVKAQPAGWNGNKSQLSAAFAAERRALGDKFETELIKWLGTDLEKHYWISFFLESKDYLHGNKRLPQLSLLVMEQGLSLARENADEKSRGYVVSFSIIAAMLSDELGLASLAISHKDEAEGLLKIDPELSAHVPAMYDADRRRYDSIRTNVDRPTPAVTAGPIPEPLAAAPPQAEISAGVLNSRAVKLATPVYPAEARDAGVAGHVEVSVLYDERGKVISARATSGHQLLRTVAEQAALQSTFTPTKLSGRPVKVRGVVIYNFVL